MKRKATPGAFGAEISELADRVSYPTNGWINLFDKDTITNGGSYNSSGVWIESDEWSESNYIPCLPGEQYCSDKTADVNYYDASKTRLSGYGISGNLYDVPNTPTIRYFRVALRNANIDTCIIVAGAYVPSYIEYSTTPPLTTTLRPKSQLYGKSLAIMGDSLSTDYAGKPYGRLISEKYGMKLYNYGISGSYVSTVGNHDPMSIRYTRMFSDADYILVFGGLNDSINNVTLSTITSNDNSTFFGSLNALTAGLVAKYPMKKIGYITPYKTVSSDDSVLSYYVQAIRDVCAKYSIPVLDLFKLGPDLKVPEVASALSDMNLHLNSVGHVWIQPKVEQFLLSL